MKPSSGAASVFMASYGTDFAHSNGWEVHASPRDKEIHERVVKLKQAGEQLDDSESES